MATLHFITLNNQQISSAEILALANEAVVNPSISEWEKQLYLFLNDWFSDSEFIHVQTSGSTGKPKLIELPKSIMQKSAERTIEYFGLKENDRLLLSLSCQYIAGKMMAVRAIIGQMNLITVDPTSDFDFLRKSIFNFGAMVPNQVLKILEQSAGKEKLQNIRNLLIGGSAISQTMQTQISSLSNRIVLTYGMTETASHIAIRELTGDLKSEYYHCLPGISVRLNKDGCLQIFLPEFKNPLQTNDLAELRPENSFLILGRADSVIISGGIKYSPETLEKKLESFINERFVISSVSDEKLGEKMVLIIEGIPFDTAFMKQRISEILQPYERPKLICFINQFPETSSGKILRNELKQIIKEIPCK